MDHDSGGAYAEVPLEDVSVEGAAAGEPRAHWDGEDSGSFSHEGPPPFIEKIYLDLRARRSQLYATPARAGPPRLGDGLRSCDFISRHDLYFDLIEAFVLPPAGAPAHAPRRRCFWMSADHPYYQVIHRTWGGADLAHAVHGQTDMYFHNQRVETLQEPLVLVLAEYLDVVVADIWRRLREHAGRFPAVAADPPGATPPPQ